MISGNNHQTAEQSKYSLGPKPRINFHKSHLSNSSNINSNKKPADNVQKIDQDRSLDDHNLILGTSVNQQEEEEISHQSTMISSSFGTSFLLSGNLLDEVAGSNESIYERNTIRYNSRNVEDFGRSVLFHRACREGSLRRVVKMLNEDETLLNSFYENVTPLYACIEDNSYEVFKELLERKVVLSEGFYNQPSTDQFTKISCLYLAVHLGNYRMVEDLLRKANFTDINIGKVVKKASAKFKETPLYLAVRLGDVKMIKTLLSETRFWPHFNLAKAMVSKSFGTVITNTIFQALFSIEGRTFLERERKSRDCFLEIKRMYNSIDTPVAAIQKITSNIQPLSLYHFGRCSFSGATLKTIHSPLYLAIMNENDYLTRELVNCVPNKYFGEFASNETESCLYLAIYKRSIHVIIYFLRINAETLEDVHKLREFAKEKVLI